MATKFWRAEAPWLEEKHIFVNGLANTSHGVRGVECSTCGLTWGGGRILPFFCPPEFAGREITSETWPQSDSAFRALKSRVDPVVRAMGYPDFELRPADRFQPFYIEVCSRPRYDFLWSFLFSAFVSQRVYNLFREEQVTGVTLCEAVLRKVGRFEPTDTPPAATNGEYEELIDEILLEEHPERFGPYYQMAVTAESAVSPEMGDPEICPSCGHKVYADYECPPTLTPDLVPDADIFLQARTSSIIVNKRVHDLITKRHLTNVTLEKVEYKSTPSHRGA